MLWPLVLRLRSSLLLAPAVAGVLSIAGCGSPPAAELPPAAEPPRAPTQTATPAGDVFPVGNRPEGIVADARTGVVAVGLRRPDRLALVDGDSGRVVRRVSLPGAPRHLQLAGAGGPVLVPDEGRNRLVQVSLGGRYPAG
ncbi:YncE family protein, partial [Patulibacter sp. S7RM1-6]